MSELEKRVGDLERRVKELEAAPKEQHTHFHSYPPVYQQPYQPPVIPSVTWYPRSPLIGPNSTTVAPLTAAGGNSW